MDENNRGCIVGNVVENSIKQAQLFGGQFYQADFAYENRNHQGEKFVIPVFFPESMKKEMEESQHPDKQVAIYGKLRSYNKDYHLYILFQVDKVSHNIEDGRRPNIIHLKATTTRRKGMYIGLKNGQRVMNWVCQVPEYNENGEVVDMNFIPVVFFGSVAKKVRDLDESSQHKINMFGVFINRIYAVHKNGKKIVKTAFEFYALQVGKIENLTKRALENKQNQEQDNRENND